MSTLINYFRYGVGFSKHCKIKGLKLFVHRAEEAAGDRDLEVVVAAETTKLATLLTHHDPLDMKPYTLRKVLGKYMYIGCILGYDNLSAGYFRPLVALLERVDPNDLLYALSTMDLMVRDGGELQVAMFGERLRVLLLHEDVRIQCRSCTVIGNLACPALYDAVQTSLLSCLHSQHPVLTVHASLAILSCLRNGAAISSAEIEAMAFLLLDVETVSAAHAACAVLNATMDQWNSESVERALSRLRIVFSHLFMAGECPKTYMNHHIPCPFFAGAALETFRRGLMLHPLHRWVELSELSVDMLTILRRRQALRGVRDPHRRRLANMILVGTINVVSAFSPGWIDSRLLIEALTTLTGFTHPNATRNAQFLGLRACHRLAPLVEAFPSEPVCLTRLRSLLPNLVDVFSNEPSGLLLATGALALYANEHTFAADFHRLTGILTAQHTQVHPFLVDALFNLIVKFAPDAAWRLNASFLVLENADIPPSQSRQLAGDVIRFVSTDATVQLHAAELSRERLRQFLAFDAKQPRNLYSILWVCVYLLGEYGHELMDRPPSPIALSDFFELAPSIGSYVDEIGEAPPKGKSLDLGLDGPVEEVDLSQLFSPGALHDDVATGKIGYRPQLFYDSSVESSSHSTPPLTPSLSPEDDDIPTPLWALPSPCIVSKPIESVEPPVTPQIPFHTFPRLVDLLNILETVVVHPLVTEDVVCMGLMATMKFAVASGFDSYLQSRVANVLSMFVSDSRIEVQTRALELRAVLAHPEDAVELLCLAPILATAGLYSPIVYSVEEAEAPEPYSSPSKPVETQAQVGSGIGAAVDAEI